MRESLFMFGVPCEIFRNVWISFTPEVAFPRHFIKTAPMVVYLIITAAFDQCGPVTVGVESDGIYRFGTAVNNKVILEHLVMSTVEKERRLTSVEYITESCTRTEVVVTIHTENADMVVSVTLHVMEVVISDNISANGIVSAGIDSAGVICNLAYIVHFVVFDNVVISVEHHCLMC